MRDRVGARGHSCARSGCSHPNADEPADHSDAEQHDVSRSNLSDLEKRGRPMSGVQGTETIDSMGFLSVAWL
jgi:hypothetical protein